MTIVADACMAYREANPGPCQVLEYLMADETAAGWLDRSTGGIGQHVHHILGRGHKHTKPNHNVRPNLILIDDLCHKYVHQYPSNGELACLYAKWKLGENEELWATAENRIIIPPLRHWFPSLLDPCCSERGTLAGRVAILTCNASGWFKFYGEELLKALEA